MLPSFLSFICSKGPVPLAIRSAERSQYLETLAEEITLNHSKLSENSQHWIVEPVSSSDNKITLKNLRNGKYLSSIGEKVHLSEIPAVWSMDILSMEGIYGNSGAPVSFQLSLRENVHGKFLVKNDNSLQLGEHDSDRWVLEKRKITVAIIGAGNRGQVYSKYSNEHPEFCQVVAVAEPRDYTRQMMAKKYSIPAEGVFRDWKEVASLGKRIADAVVITTQDRMHAEPAIAFANMGYHILLEKPMSVTEQECIDIVDAVEKNKVVFAVGHVLRYTPYSRKVKEILESGAIGDVVSMQHLEPVGFWHFAHSYVRGNWRRQDQSSFTLMAKSCHDIDWISWMMPSKCIKVSSFGSLRHFTKENMPKGAADRCMECSVENSCPYSAKKIYLERIQWGEKNWPVNVLSETPTVESITEALVSGPYGRCVYKCDNDVVDNQVVTMLFEGGRTATFSMIAFSEEICVRKTKIFGTRGELEGDGGNTIRVFDFLTQKSTQYRPEDIKSTQLSGHGNADYYLMRTFVDAVGSGDPDMVLSHARETLRSHLVVFAAEKSRLEGEIKDLSW